MYFRSKAEAERLLRGSSVPATILRCSYVIGHGGELTPAILDGLQRGRLDVIGSGQYRIQPLFIDDVVSVLVAAASEVSNDDVVVDLIGEPIAFRDFVELFVSKGDGTTAIESVSIEQVIRDSIREFDPPITLSELAVLLCDLVGEPTRTCYGVSLRRPEAIVEAVLRRS